MYRTQGQGHLGQSYRRTQVHHHGNEVVENIQSRPDAALICSTGENKEPERCHDEAEHGDKHHPAQRVVRDNQRGGNQDPHQTAEHKLWDEEEVWNRGEDLAAAGQEVSGGGGHSVDSCAMELVFLLFRLSRLQRALLLSAV